MSKQFEELGAAALAATQGDWEFVAVPVMGSFGATAEIAKLVIGTGQAETLYMINADGLCPALTGTGPNSANNARFLTLSQPKVITALLSELEEYKRIASMQTQRISELQEQRLQQPSIADVIAERQRQRDKGRDDNHDDDYIEGVLALGGAAYAVSGAGMNGIGTYRLRAKNLWPFPKNTFNPAGNANRRKDLVRGAAMIIAEIDKIDRAKAKGK